MSLSLSLSLLFTVRFHADVTFTDNRFLAISNVGGTVRWKMRDNNARARTLPSRVVAARVPTKVDATRALPFLLPSCLAPR